MKKALGILLAVAALSSVASAQEFFAGGSLSALYVSDADGAGTNFTIGFFGGQVGSYNLLGPVGGRLSVDFSVTPISGLFSGSVDLLAASTGDTKFYGGAGLGLLSFFGVSTPFVKGVAGADFEVADSVSLFIEAAPSYVIEAQSFFIGGRFGVNFAFGQ